MGKVLIFIIHILCGFFLLFSNVSADSINTEDPLIYDHLGDVFLTKAWVEYSSSYDIKPSKTVREKLNAIEKKISQKELHKQMILRSANNYAKALSFKTGFILNLSSKKIYIKFSYVKNDNIKIDLLSSFLAGGISVFIKNGKIEFLPQGVEGEIQQIFSDIILQICDIFSGNFYEQFMDAKITKRGKHLIYSKNDVKLTLNTDTALVESFSKNKLTVHVLKYRNFCVSKIPSKIKFKFSDLKINGKLEAVKILPI
ncbi:MAG: hypothetical protein LBU29_02880 [Endomicrobium sp.]|jgi:hypothetical protein|nr:hypothetical protein [Endomicrobium sp.]